MSGVLRYGTWPWSEWYSDWRLKRFSRRAARYLRVWVTALHVSVDCSILRTRYVERRLAEMEQRGIVVSRVNAVLGEEEYTLTEEGRSLFLTPKQRRRPWPLATHHSHEYEPGQWR